ncbi:hypothetical protein GCM10022405_06950 [Gibbsiella dentisursi]|uniref:Uncharacterized protein n=1 Tax=Gibbsiella dentisursi TaxID=796890 RepID=A0ABP7KPU3_9GAMM
MGVGDRQCWRAIVFGLFPHPVPLPKGEGVYYAAWVCGIGSAGWQLCTVCSLSLGERVRVRGD